MSNKIELPEGSGAKFFDVYFLGIGLVIAGHSVYWSLGFSQGFWEFFTSTMVISVAYICLCLCLAEMISILPFSGGSYGFSRVTTGPYFGFIVGFFDSVSNIIYVSLFVRTCTAFFQFAFYDITSSRYDPLWWAILYIGLFFLHILLGKHSFKFISIFGFICLIIPIIYILGTAHLQDFQTNVIDLEKLTNHVPFERGVKGFVRLLPPSALMYFGIDMLCLVCEDTRDAVRVVPKVIMATVLTLFVLAMALIVCAAAQYPTVFYLHYYNIPLSFGFAKIFHTTINYATITVLPSQFIVLYALMYVYGRQICALSRSSLLPAVFSYTTKDNTPYVAIILGMVLGYICLVALKFGTQNFDSTLYKMYYAAQMGSITVYIISMISFIIFRYKYSTLQRHFRNWGGIASAVLGIVIFAFTWVGLGFLQGDHFFVIKVYSGLFGFASVYYILYARKHQSFSQEEQSILFAVYIIKANSRHRTLYRSAEKKIRKVLKYVDPENSLFSGSPKKGSSRNNSRRNLTGFFTSKVLPVKESSHSKDSKPEPSTVDPAGVNSMEYVLSGEVGVVGSEEEERRRGREGCGDDDALLDGEAEYRVSSKESRSGKLGKSEKNTTATAGVIEMRFIQDSPTAVIHVLDDIPHEDMLESPGR